MTKPSTIYYFIVLLFLLLGTVPLGAFSQHTAESQELPILSDNETYFPPPDAEGGWRKATNRSEILRVAGMDKQKLDKAFALIKKSTKNGGLLVLRHGWLVYEHYFGKGAREATPNLGSIAKSFTSISVGMLMAEYPKLFPDGLDQKVFNPIYFPKKSFPLTDSSQAKIKLGQLLAFTAGIRGNNPVRVWGKKETIDPAGPDGWHACVDSIALGKKSYRDKGKTFSTKTLWTKPGGGYSYATSSAHLASMVVRHISGMELRSYVKSHLAEPLDWGRWGWGYQHVNLKHTCGGGGIAVRATDMLRFGYLLLQNGQWQDHHLVPANYVEKVSRWSPYNPHSSYSLDFDINTDNHYPELPRDAFWKQGSGGHVLYIVPSLNLVVWKLGGRDFQYSPKNTGLPELPDSRAKHQSRADWSKTVDPVTAARKTLDLVIKAIEPSKKP